MALSFGPRRGMFINIADRMETSSQPLSSEEVSLFELFDLIYRSLCSILFN